MKKILDTFKYLDLTKPLYFVPLFLLLIISRLPLLDLGFGYDIDGWVEVNSAFNTAHTLEYIPSRGLGHPLYELLVASLLKIDERFFSSEWIITNSANFLIFLLCVIFFYKILDSWRIERKGLLIIFFCFLPVIWKNSTMTVDFMLSLMFLLLSQYLAISNRYNLSAIALGFACGARFQNGIMLIPMLYLIISQTSFRKKDAIKFLIIFSLLTFIFLIPFLNSYGIPTYEQYKEVGILKSNLGMYILKAGYRGIYRFIGIDAAIFLLGCLIFQTNGIKRLFVSLRDRNEKIVFSSLVVLIFALLFAKYPFKQEYMLPLVPSAIILLNHILNRKTLLTFFLIAILNGFLVVPGVTINFTPHGEIFPDVHIFGKGTLLEDIEKRKDLIGLKEFLKSDIIKDHSVVVWHRYQMAYVFFNRYEILKSGQYKIEDNKLLPLDAVYDKERDIYYTGAAVLHGMSSIEIMNILREKNLYYIPCAVKLTKNKLGINLLEFNPILIEELRPHEY